MKQLTTLMALVIVALCLPASGRAATASDEIAQMREELQAVVERLDKLDKENAELKAENEELKAQGDYLKAEARGLRKDAAIVAADAAKVKGADWAGKVSLKGDLRYRYEYISDEARNGAGVRTADRYRDRIRARLNLEAKATDTLTVGLGFATTENDDPRSSNQTLDGTFSRKALDLDLGYFDWKFANGADLIGGKMKQPFVKPGQSFFWDGDINPEGLAVTFSRGMWFGSAYRYWVDEISGAETARTSDTMLYGAQLGVRMPVGESTLMLAAHYYDLSAGQGRSPFYNNNANGNTVTTGATPNLLVYDYEVIDVGAEFNMMLNGMPLQLWADVAQNRDPDDLDTAWSAGVLFNKAGNSKTWEVGAAYTSIEKDALFGQLVDSDFGGGTTDTEGWVLRGAYAPLRNWTLNATYFINQRNVDVGTESDYDRLQLDFNVKF